MHWLQPDEDGGQGEKMILKQVLATLDLHAGDVCPHAEAAQA